LIHYIVLMFHYEEKKISEMEITLERYESLISNEIRKKQNSNQKSADRSSINENSKLNSQSVLSSLNSIDDSALKPLIDRANHVQFICKSVPNHILQLYQPIYSSFRHIMTTRCRP